jgi:hypothetical protein
LVSDCEEDEMAKFAFSCSDGFTVEVRAGGFSDAAAQFRRLYLNARPPGAVIGAEGRGKSQFFKKRLHEMFPISVKQAAFEMSMPGGATSPIL